MRDAIRDHGPTEAPGAARDAIDPLLSMPSRAKPSGLAETCPGGAATHPELRGDLAIEALFQVLVDLGDGERVDEVAHAGQRVVGRMEIGAREAEERAVVERDHDRAVRLDGPR